MVVNMKVTSKTERKMARAHLSGLMAINILVAGRKESNMALVFG